MKFIKLTDGLGRTIYINFDSVIAFAQDSDDQTLTLIDVISGEELYIKETPEEIVSLLEKMK